MNDRLIQCSTYCNANASGNSSNCNRDFIELYGI